MFPEVSIHDDKDDPSRVWVATCTLRPPVISGRGQTFVAWMQTLPELSEADLQHCGRDLMQVLFGQAHPNGCPAAHGTLTP